MGARPSTFRKQGGGFLNGTDGTITGYRWTDQFNGEDFEPGNKPGTKDPKFHSLFMEISVRVDGADEDITQNLFAGDYEQFSVSKDELTLTAAEGGECAIGQNTAAAKFIASLCANNFPEDRLSDDDESINFEPVIGTRVRFGQETELGKDGKPRMRVAKKGKFKGKSFPQTTTVVEQVYDLPGKAGKKSKDAEEAPKGKTSKGKPAPAEDDEEDLTAIATKFLIKVVKGNKGKLKKSQISMQLLDKENGLFKHPEREAIRKILTSDKFLGTEDGWSYNDETEVVKVTAKSDDDE